MLPYNIIGSSYVCYNINLTLQRFYAYVCVHTHTHTNRAKDKSCINMYNTWMYLCCVYILINALFIRKTFFSMYTLRTRGV